MSLAWYLVLAAVLFAIGAVVVLVRRSAVISLMGVELMLNSARGSNIDGQIMAFFVMVVAAAEVVVGLSIIVSIYRSRATTSVDDANLLKH